MLGIVVSRADSASTHIGEHLRDLADWTERRDGTRPDAEGGGTVYRTDGAELREFEAIHLELDGVADAFGTVDDGPDREPDLVAFASRHAGETGPLLTAHHTGNFGPAEFGGDDRDLARAAPAAHSRVLAALAEHAPDGYEVGTECTHHGPTDVGAPSLFVELGSGEPQWADPAGARAVAAAVLDLRGVAPDAPVETGPDRPADGTADASPDAGGDRRHLVGFGGGHYAPRFERIARETDWAVGHVAPDWGLDELGDPDDERGVLDRVFAESAATRAVVDGDRPDLERVVEAMGYRVVSETWVRETGGIPLGLAGALEDALGTVADGLRFGDPARADPTGAAAGRPTAGSADATGATEGRSRAGSADGDPADFLVVDLPADLLAEAQGIDREAARAAVERSALAFETTDNGTRVEGRAAVADPADRDALVDDLAAVLDAEYDDVERTDGAVVARETAFDPERARELGVPEGPKFGQLSAGRPVEVDGETVAPEDVRVERERRLPVDGA